MRLCGWRVQLSSLFTLAHLGFPRSFSERGRTSKSLKWSKNSAAPSTARHRESTASGRSTATSGCHYDLFQPFISSSPSPSHSLDYQFLILFHYLSTSPRQHFQILFVPSLLSSFSVFFSDWSLLLRPFIIYCLEIHSNFSINFAFQDGRAG